MPRTVTWGTPGRASQYLFPRSPFGVLLYSLGASVVVLVLLFAFHAAGDRGALAPGKLASAHAPIESRCQECHGGVEGVTDARCQRCHDPSGGARTDTKAHVLFGSGDPKRAAATRNLACVSCHVEHRGRTHDLSAVDLVSCSQCHFRRFTSHPEFSVLRAAPSASRADGSAGAPEPPAAAESLESPGLQFGHKRHIEEVLKASGAANPLESCNRCHEYAQPDFTPIDFGRHCASCHAREGSVGEMDFVPEEDVAGAVGDGFESRRGSVRKSAIPHRDPWVLANLRTLSAQVDPEGYAAARGALVARLNQLTRRRALAVPLAGLDRDALARRAESLTVELAAIDRRLAAFSPGATAEAVGKRFDEVSRVVAELSSEAAGSVGSLGEALHSAVQGPLEDAALEDRRKEILSLLDAVDAEAPEAKAVTADLRRRVLALRSSDDSRDVLSRARADRVASLERVQEEIRLRDLGTSASPNVLLLREARAFDRSIEEVTNELRGWPAVTSASLPEDVRERKAESLGVLTGVCTKCHVRTRAPRFDVRAAERVLVRSRFVHAPHLLPTEGDCARCHPDVLASTESPPLNFSGIESCRTCHRAQGSRTDCALCHRYHPPPLP